MWRQTQLARKAASLSRLYGTPKFNSLQVPVPLNSLHHMIFSNPSEPSSGLDKWAIRRPVLFQHLKYFSSDPSLGNTSELPPVEPNIGPAFDSCLNSESNPELFSSEYIEKDVLFSESWDNFVTNGGENETGLGENEEKVEELEVNDVEKLQSLLSLLYNRGGETFEDELDGLKLVLSEDSVLEVIESPQVPGENLIAFYRWCLGKSWFSVTRDTLGALVRVVCGELKKNNAYKLWDMLKEVGEEDGKLSTEILNELISLFSKLGKGKAAYEVYEKFDSFGCIPDASTFYYTIEALYKRSIFGYASSVSGKMVSSKILPDAEKVGKLIYYLCKGNNSRDAYSVFLLAKEKNVYPPRSSVNFLISSLCFLPKKDKASIRNDIDKLYNENIYLALEMLEDFQGKDRSYAVQPFSSVSQALCKIGDVGKAKELLFNMIEAGPPPGNAIFNAIINGLSKSGDLEEAVKLLKVMEDRGLKPDVYTYSVIMSGYVKGGAMYEAHRLLDEAKKKHAKLSPVTYHTLIRGYCKLEQFDEAVKLLGEMEDYGVQPKGDEYNKLIQSLCLKALDWEMAEKLLEEMKAKGLHLNGITGGLIRAVKELIEERGNQQVTAVA